MVKKYTELKKASVFDVHVRFASDKAKIYLENESGKEITKILKFLLRRRKPMEKQLG
jgi:hypothetical protein